MFQKNRLSAAVMAALAGVAVSLPVSALAQAQRVEVTGSNIKRLDAETLQPVVIIGREEIERSGRTTLNEVLQTLTVINGGSFSEATSAGNSFAPGTAAVSLRGLGANTTLTLLNGRRIANYGFAQNLNENFVDLNSIPVTAIDRIEVLKDGASAIYGSDAIAGVINVILRRDFRGGQFSGTAGVSSRGGADEKRASLTYGVGDLTKDRYNFLGTLDYYARERLNSSDRSFSASADQRDKGPGGRDVRSPTGSPGYFFGGTGNPNTPYSTCPQSSIQTAATLGVGGGGNVCAFDFASANDLLPDTKRIGFLGTGTVQLNNDFQLFAEALANSNTTNTSAAPTPAAFTLAANHPDRPAGSTFTAVAYRFLAAGNRLNTLETDSNRFVLGVRGTVLGKVDIEAALLSGRSKTTNTGFNYIIQENAQRAFAGTLPGFEGQFFRVINPGLNSPAFVDAIKISPVRLGDSRVKGADFKASTEIGRLPGGMAAIAAGLEYREETIADDPDPRVALTNPSRITVAGSGGTAVRGGRDLTSAYAELSLPLMKGLETQVAVRTDQYSDFGRATTPKVGFSLRPTQNLLIRGGAARGFRAPSLAEIFLGESTSFPTVQDAPRCAAYRAGPLGASDPRTIAACGGATGSGASAQVRTIFLGNQNLDPETSKSYSLGLVFEPVKAMSLAIDGYIIEHRNRILAPTAAFVLANEALFPGAVVRNAPSADDIAAKAPGGLRGVSGDLTAGIVRSFFNASRQQTHGVDVDARYRLGLGDMGRLDLGTTFTYMGSLKRQLNPGQPLVELKDTFGFPRVRNSTQATWSRGVWTSNLAMNTIGSYKDSFSVSGEFPRVGRMTTFDMNVQYTGIKNMRLTLGGLNITDRKPPFSNVDWYAFDTSTHSPRGAFYYGRVSYAF